MEASDRQQDEKYDQVTYAYDMQNFRVDVEVAVNSVFFSWIVGFGGLVKIKYQDDVKAEYARFVTKAYDALWS